MNLNKLSPSHNLKRWTRLGAGGGGGLETIILQKTPSTVLILFADRNASTWSGYFATCSSFRKKTNLSVKWSLRPLNRRKILSGFPETVAVTKMSPFTEKVYFIDTRVIDRTTKCETCKTELKLGDIQASTEGPQLTIQRQWIISTFYYCPQIRCITRMPRNGYNQPFCPSKLTLTFSPSLTPWKKR